MTDTTKGQTMKYTLIAVALFSILTAYAGMALLDTAMAQRAHHHAVMQCMSDTECEATDQMKGAK